MGGGRGEVGGRGEGRGGRERGRVCVCRLTSETHFVCSLHLYSGEVGGGRDAGNREHFSPQNFIGLSCLLPVYLCARNCVRH